MPDAPSPHELAERLAAKAQELPPPDQMTDQQRHMMVAAWMATAALSDIPPQEPAE